MTKTDEKILILKRITRRLARRLANANKSIEAADKNIISLDTRNKKLLEAYRSLKSGGAQATPANVPLDVQDCYQRALAYIARNKFYKDKDRFHYKKSTNPADYTYVTWVIDKIADDIVDLQYQGEFVL